MEPQLDEYSNYCEEPGVRVNSVLLNSLGTQWPNNMESDDSEDDDMLPTEEYWAIPDDGWTLVEKPHAKPRGVSIGHQTVSTELVNLPQKWITRGFLELAEEARLVDVRSTPSSCMDESVQQIPEIREPMSRDISWKIEEVVDRSVNSFSDVATRMPTVKFDLGQLMQWPNGKSTGMMICEYTLESQMFSHGPVWREAEPVFVAAESEVLTPVFTGEFVVETDPLVVAEAVTPRVSALPTVGSDFQTGLSTAVGGEDRCSLSSGNILDKVDHVAGQLEARTVPVEDLLLFSAVYFVMPSLLRSLTVQTSTFFLSDEREEVKMLLNVREDRPVRARRLYVHDVDIRAQMTKEIHGVGPNGDRWDGIDVIDERYMGCVWMKSQPGNQARLLRGNTFSEKFGLESGPAVRTGPSALDLDWLNGHPNRSDGLVDNIRSAPHPGWVTQSSASIVAVHVCVLLLFHIQFIGRSFGDVVCQFLEVGFGV